MSLFRWRCFNCGHEVEREHNGLRPPAGDCPSCATDTLEAVIEAGCVGTREGRRSRAGSGYHPGLARFPNDPKAHVDGHRDLVKLMDRRRREAERQGYGVKIGNATDVASAGKPKEIEPVSLERLMREEGKS